MVCNTMLPIHNVSVWLRTGSNPAEINQISTPYWKAFPSVCQSICLSVCLFDCPSIGLSVYLFVLQLKLFLNFLESLGRHMREKGLLQHSGDDLFLAVLHYSWLLLHLHHFPLFHPPLHIIPKMLKLVLGYDRISGQITGYPALNIRRISDIWIVSISGTRRILKMAGYPAQP